MRLRKGRISLKFHRCTSSQYGAVETLTIEEGLCVQCLHIGSYDDEPATRSEFHNRSNERVSSLFRSPFVTVWGYR